MNVGQAIIDGTTDIFTTMLMVDPEAGLPEEGAGGNISSNITSMIGLGKDIKGVLSIHFPEKTAKYITSSFLGMEVTELDDNVKDAIGEIANMIAGNLKISFKENGRDIELAIPTTVIGKSFRIAGMSSARRTAVPFTLNGSTFLVELKFVDNNS